MLLPKGDISLPSLRPVRSQAPLDRAAANDTSPGAFPGFGERGAGAELIDSPGAGAWSGLGSAGPGLGTAGVTGSSGVGTRAGSSGCPGVPGSGTAGVTGASGTAGVAGSWG